MIRSAVATTRAEIARTAWEGGGLSSVATTKTEEKPSRWLQPHANPTDHRETGGNGGNRWEQKRLLKGGF